MGKTIRMSTRTSKSPYMSKKRKSQIQNPKSHPATRSSAAEATTLPPAVVSSAVTTNPPPAVVTATTTPPTVGSVDTSSLASSIADSIRQQLVPEIQTQVVQAVSALRETPVGSSTPDSTNLTGISATVNTNNENNFPNSFSSINDQLGTNVSQTLKEKITNGEYIDLGLLLTNTAHGQEHNNIIVMNNGQLQCQPKSGKKISDISSWIDAFLIFMSIYVGSHPESAMGLIKYMYTVKLGASRSSGLSWYEYDQQFRYKVHKNSEVSWGVVDQELWLLYMQHSQSTSLPATSFPQTQYSARKCFEYNNKGRCNIPNCRFAHRCLRCNYPHPAIKCHVQNVNKAQTNWSHNQNVESNQNFIGRPGFSSFGRGRGRNMQAGGQLSHFGVNGARKNAN